MFGLPSWRIGRVFGIPLEVNPTWLLIFGLVAVTLAFSYFPAIGVVAGLPVWIRLAMGVITALLFFASIVAHELSHSLVARWGGIRIARVTLFMFGGVAQMEEEPDRPGHEFWLAVAGPVMSLALAALFSGGYVLALLGGASAVLWAPLQYLSMINVSVALFNLLPGFPLDGGRVLRAVLWALTGDILRATRWASRSGQVIGVLMMTAGVTGVLLGTLDLIWLGLIGWFISTLAESAYRQQVARSALEGVTVRDAMTPGPAVVPGEITIERLVHDHLLGGRHSRYPVVVDGAVVGLVTLAGAKSVARAEWPFVTVADVAERDVASLAVSPRAPLESIAARLGPDGSGALLVVEDGIVVGIVTREDMLRVLRIGSA